MPRMSDDQPGSVSEPFPISLVSHRFLLYDVDTITYVRREHRICGVLIGTLAPMPQQNVFLGSPLELLPEEARLLVEKGAGYVVDDVTAHLQGISGLGEEEREAFQKSLQREGIEAARSSEKRADARREAAFRRLAAKARKVQESSQFNADEDAPSSPSASASTLSTSLQPYPITPTTSYPPLPPPPSSPSLPLPAVPPSYPLYAHLHSQDYYMTPGLRFGCQYSVYPGDPLRFHSHFLAVGVGWDEELDLLDLVGGGRLGTGVKKGYLIGGEEADGEGGGTGKVRTVCIEWASM
ncbi:MAG: tRNA-splicing endonuclease subunit [Thelocarpon impressellum]|nr:MAG: tRNA-splicing endonuclease subunit [Thelocarpon impressellum]